MRDHKFHAVSSSKIYTVAPDGSDRNLLHDITGEGHLSASLSWSPDGSRLAFAAMEGNRLRVFSSDRSGGDLRVVAEPDVAMPVDEVEVGKLSWSPDISQILISVRNRYSYIESYTRRLISQSPFTFLTQPGTAPILSSSQEPLMLPETPQLHLTLISKQLGVKAAQCSLAIDELRLTAQIEMIGDFFRRVMRELRRLKKVVQTTLLFDILQNSFD